LAAAVLAGQLPDVLGGPALPVSASGRIVSEIVASRGVKIRSVHSFAMKFPLACFVASLLPLLFPAALPALGPNASEYDVKAAMIYNFALFVEWPDQSFTSAGESISVCILGEDPFGQSLETNFAGKTVRGRELQVHRVQRVAELQTCHIAFISPSERKRLPEIISALGTSSVLTIGDVKDFAELGGVIGFRVEDEKIHFDINVKAAQRANLKISYKLLNLATVYGQEGKAGD
jgi:hypothetical protein